MFYILRKSYHSGKLDKLERKPLVKTALLVDRLSKTLKYDEPLNVGYSTFIYPCITFCHFVLSTQVCGNDCSFIN